MSGAQRIVSLLPAATEMVCALGATDRLVGRSHECDFPPGLEHVPVCSSPRVAMDGDSTAIGDRVRRLVEHGLAVFEVDAERLRTLAPDLVITQTQCEVCAVGLDEVRSALSTWTGAEPKLVSLAPAALRDVLADIQTVAEQLGCAREGQSLRARIRERMRDIDGAANGITGAPSVVCIEWIDPLMVAGNWVPELVDLAGGDDRLGRAGEHSPCIEWQQVLDQDPDVLLVMPCGFDLARSREAAAELAGLPGHAELAAVRGDQVYALDGHHYFNRPGPRLAESLEILAEIFHPQRFDFGHRGNGWERVAPLAG